MIIALSAWRDCEVIGKPPAFWVPDARLPEPTLGCCFFHLLSCLPDFSFVLATETQMLYSFKKYLLQKLTHFIRPHCALV